MLPAARAKAEAIAEHPVGALRKSKRLLMDTHGDRIREAMERENVGMGECIGSPENLAALEKFFARKG